MASVSNIFHGHIEMDMTHNLLSFLKHAGLEIFVDFLTTKNEKQNFFDEHFLLNKIKEAEDADDIVFTVEQPTQVKDGRMDGIIRSETEQDDFMIVIESKRDEQAREWQLKKYSDDLESKSIDKNKCLLVSLSGWIDKGIEPTKGVIYKTWKELVKHLKTQLDVLSEEDMVKKFLIEQFKDYLEERGYGMYDKEQNLTHLTDNPQKKDYLPHWILKNVVLKNYQLLSDEIANEVRTAYISKYEDKDFDPKPKREKNDLKKFFWERAILMHLCYLYLLKSDEVHMRVFLEIKLEVKDYIGSHMGLGFSALEKHKVSIQDQIKRLHGQRQGQNTPTNKLWTEKGGGDTWTRDRGKAIWCWHGYRRPLLKEEVDAILQEDFDSEPFKKMLEDYCMLLHFAEQFASENT